MDIVTRSIPIDDADYSFDDADLIIRSSDGIRFHIHSLIMKLSSTVFCDMFLMKRAVRETPVDPVVLEEPSGVLRIILDILYSHIHQKRYTSVHAVAKNSLVDLQNVALAMEKYNMGTATLVLQDVFTSKARTSTDTKDASTAFGCYALVWSLGWKKVAQDISTFLISFDFNSKTVLTLLDSMDELASLRLRQLVEKRRDILYNAICDCFAEECSSAYKKTVHAPSGSKLTPNGTDSVSLLSPSTCGYRYKHPFKWGKATPLTLLAVINGAGTIDENVLKSGQLKSFWGVKCEICCFKTERDTFMSNLRLAIDGPNGLPNKIDISTIYKTLTLVRLF